MCSDLIGESNVLHLKNLYLILLYCHFITLLILLLFALIIYVSYIIVGGKTMII